MRFNMHERFSPLIDKQMLVLQGKQAFAKITATFVWFGQNGGNEGSRLTPIRFICGFVSLFLK